MFACSATSTANSMLLALRDRVVCVRLCVIVVYIYSLLSDCYTLTTLHSTTANAYTLPILTNDGAADVLQHNNRCERRCELMEWCAAAWRFTAPCGTTPLQTTAALAELATDRYTTPDAVAVAKYTAAGEVPIISHFAKRVETAAAAAQAWADAVRDATEPAIPANPEVRTLVNSSHYICRSRGCAVYCHTAVVQVATCVIAKYKNCYCQHAGSQSLKSIVVSRTDAIDNTPACVLLLILATSWNRQL
jgi:hypothetical protein